MLYLNRRKNKCRRFIMTMLKPKGMAKRLGVTVRTCKFHLDF